MELTPVRNSFGTSVYKTENGTVIKMKKGSGSVQVSDQGTITVTGGENVKIRGTNGDDRIIAQNSHIKTVNGVCGQDHLFFNGCKFNDYNMFWGTGSAIHTGISRSKQDDFTEVVIKGDFNGAIFAQQGSGKGYGDDSKAHKDKIVVFGDNKGHIQVDTHDKVMVKGQKGHIFNQTVYVVPV